MAEKLGPVFHVSRIGVSSEFGGDTYTLKLHCHDRDQAETLKRRLLEEKLMPGPFPAQFAEQAESIETGKLAQAMSWLGLSAPSGEMLSWWVGREVNRLLDAVLEQREAMRNVQPVAWIVYAPNGNVRLWSPEQRQANECAEANGLTVTPAYASPFSAVPQATITGDVTPGVRKAMERFNATMASRDDKAMPVRLLGYICKDDLQRLPIEGAATLYEVRQEMEFLPPADQFEVYISAVPDGVHSCRKCGGAMKPGKAILNTYAASDEGTVNEAAHVGTAPLVDCVKCEACGWSVTDGVGSLEQQRKEP